MVRLPNSPVKKSLARPHKIPKFVWKLITTPPRQYRVGQLQDELPKQPNYLYKLRQKEEFCLIILDACRFDKLAEQFDKYFVGTCDPIWSVATSTFEFLRYMWPEEYEYPYITAAAPVTSQEFDFQAGEKADGMASDGQELYLRYGGYQPRNHFRNLVEVWREAWDEDLGVTPPEPVTKKAIEIASNKTTNRVVIHFFQPHGPFIGEETLLGDVKEYDTNVRGGAVEGGIWNHVRENRISDEQLNRLYESNLHRALAAVARLVQKTNFEKYVITGDHGEALGEYGQYYHGIEHPMVRQVPWAEISAVKDSAPEMWKYQDSSTSVDKDTIERLQELGYIE